MAIESRTVLLDKRLYQWIGFNWFTWWLIVAVSVVGWLCWRNSRYVRLIDAIPGPKGIPVLGNLLQVYVDQVGKTHDNIQVIALG